MSEVFGPADRTILCIEDEADLRELIVEELEESGYRVLEAADGLEAIALLGLEQPDLILCDISMPNMGGYELLDYLRQPNSDWLDIPFVFLTAQDGSGQIVQGKYAGADDYLVKPINFDLMLATIETRLRQVSRLRQKIVQETLLGAQGAGKISQTLFERIVKTFDLIKVGIVLLDSQAQVQFINSTAQKLLFQSAELSFSELLVQQQERAYIYHAAIRKAIAQAAEGQDYIEFVSLPRGDGRRDVLLSVCALDAKDAEAHDPVVALFFRHNHKDEPAPFKALETLFQLTPTESRVAWAFVKGMRPEEIASAFSISITTVAFHKRNIFQKTHTNRQVDLITLLLTLPVTAIE